MKRRLFVGLCVGLFASTSGAEERRPITAQDLWAVQRVGAPALSPDGRTAVVAVTEWSIPKGKSTSSLWLVDVASASTRRLTQGGSDAAPSWSPDGKRIAFVSRRGDDDATALYVIAADGGEARRVAGAPYGLRAARWLTNGRLAALTQVIPELAGKLSRADLDAVRKEMRRRRDAPLTARVTEDRQYRFWDHPLAEGIADKLVAIDAETGAFTDLTSGWNRVFSTVMEPGFDVSPDGRSIAMAINSTPPPYREHPNLDVYLIPTDGSGAMISISDGSIRCFAVAGEGGQRIQFDEKIILDTKRLYEIGQQAGGGKLGPGAKVMAGLVPERRKDGSESWYLNYQDASGKEVLTIVIDARTGAVKNVFPGK